MRKLTLALSALLLSGCNTISIVFSDKLYPELTPSSKIARMELISTETKSPLPIPSICTTPKPDKDSHNVEKSSLAVWAPIAGKFIVDQIQKKTTEYVQKIKAQSSKTTTFRTVIYQDALLNSNCLAIYRGKTSSNNATQPELTYILRIEDHKENTLSFTPIYALAKKTISLTSCEGGCNKKGQESAKINVAVAARFTAPSRSAFGELKLVDLGVITTTIPEITLRTPKDVSDSNPSEIVTLPSCRKTSNSSGVTNNLPLCSDLPVQITLAITEIGNIAGDPDVAEGEIKAAAAVLKEGALGEIQAYLSRREN